MIKGVLDHHPQRFHLTNELHARPFTPMPVPGRVVMLAFKEPHGALERNLDRDRDHLISLIDRHGGAHPAPAASHYFGDFDRFRLKWERHTEFVSYTLFESGETNALFDTDLAAQFPAEWLADAPGKVIAAIQVELIETDSLEAADALVTGPLAKQFSAESLVISRVLDGAGLAIGDFRIHEGGFARFAVVIHNEVGARRIGRVAQRLVEIETYRTLAMLALPLARKTAARLNDIERELTDLTGKVATDDAMQDAEILGALTALSAEIEALSAASAFRFGAANAYEAIVQERIGMLREERLHGRQLYAEFMARRFAPAMRTCHATVKRLTELATRASRIADLLRTRVNVAVEAQNQHLLESMDKRAATQLRLQETVEGLSVVAISYYAVSLTTYLTQPLAERLGVTSEALTAMLAVVIILIVWAAIRRMRIRIMEKFNSDVAAGGAKAPPKWKARRAQRGSGRG
ncbi:MAG: DUF3422 domain-containing protein [Pseudomonadota bacterium]